MHSVSKLVRQIRDAMAKDGSNAPVESLAAEYARLCQESNQRLESCAAMVKQRFVGQEPATLIIALTVTVWLGDSGGL